VSLRVAVADDAVLFRTGIVHVLADLGFDVITEVGDATTLLAAIERDRPDLAIVDIRMPPTHTDEGLRAAHTIGQRFPGVGVVVLSGHVEVSFAMRLLSTDARGRGYLLKDRVADLDSFADALVRVADGGSVVDQSVVAALVGVDRDGPVKQLTSREVEILGLMAEGRSNAGICERLVLSPRTVESHVREIMHKLQLPRSDDDHRRVLAVLAYLQAQSMGGRAS
jgi:DNA-binding NarL/FixJ family response regulator